MTVQEIYQQDIKKLAPAKRLDLANLILSELEADPALQALVEAALANVQVSNQRLLALAAAHPPPQSWWDDQTDPFKPVEK